jgi:hypothetical protein
MNIESIGMLIQIAGGLAVAAAIYSFIWGGTDYSELKKLARKYHGAVKKDRWNEYTSLQLCYKDRNMSLFNGRGGDVANTKLILDFANARIGDWQIQPNSAIERFSTGLGFQDIALGNDRFDHEFLVKAKPGSESNLRIIFMPEMQAALLNIRDMAPCLYGRENQIEITTSEYYDLGSYERLLAVGRGLIDRVA